LHIYQLAFPYFFIEIETLKLEVEGKINPCDAMELKMAVLQQKINQLVDKQDKMKTGYEKTIEQLNQKVLELGTKLDDVTSSSSATPSSPDGQANGFFSWAFRKQERKHKEHPN
jgi:uncharacterized protein with von Willebrand factor type A (vWA) domain